MEKITSFPFFSSLDFAWRDRLESLILLSIFPAGALWERFSPHWIGRAILCGLLLLCAFFNVFQARSRPFSLLAFAVGIFFGVAAVAVIFRPDLFF